MRKTHTASCENDKYLRDWPDGKLMVKQGGHSETSSEFQRQLRQPKHVVPYFKNTGSECKEQEMFDITKTWIHEIKH